MANWLALIATLLTIGGAALAAFRWWRGHVVAIAKYDRTKPISGRAMSVIDVETGMAALIRDARLFHPDEIVGINRGGAIVGGWLAKKLGLSRITLLTVNYDQQGGQRVVEHNGGAPLRGRILLVDDAKRKGEHMRAAAEYLTRTYPSVSVRKVVLLEMVLGHQGPETDAFQGGPADFYGFHTFDSKVVPPWD